MISWYPRGSCWRKGFYCAPPASSRVASAKARLESRSTYSTEGGRTGAHPSSCLSSHPPTLFPRVAQEFKGKFLFLLLPLSSPRPYRLSIPSSPIRTRSYRRRRSRSILTLPLPSLAFYCITASLAIIDIRGKQL